MACSGSMVSSMRSLPTIASHALNGSAFLEGIDWMMRKSCSVLATSVRRRLPSAAFIFNWLQFVVSSLPSFFSLTFRTLQYLAALRLSFCSVKTATTSTIEKYHSSFSASHAVRIFWSSKSWIELLSFTSAIEGSSLSLSKSILHDFGWKRHPV